MNAFSSLRVRLVGVVFLAIAPALALMLYTGRLWPGLVGGLLALLAAWLGGELFILRYIDRLLQATRRLADGDLSTRTGLAEESGELGLLAREIDTMAASLEHKVNELEQAEKSLLNRAHQQTVIAALGQFALVTTDLAPLLNHAVLFISQTLDVQYAEVLERVPGQDGLLLRTGSGWKDEDIGQAVVDIHPGSLTSHALLSTEPVIVPNLRSDSRFRGPVFFERNGVVSSVMVAVSGHSGPFGILGVHTTQPRDFAEDDVHFLQTVGNLLAMAIERKRTEPELQKLAAFARFNPNPILELTSDGALTYCNEAAVALSLSLGFEKPRDVLPQDVESIAQTCLATAQNRLRMETRIGNRVLSWSFYPIAQNQLVHCYVEDVTERTSLEAQLRQAQKMESVGQLAAGVAHDFNNLLTVISGHSGLLMNKASLPPEVISSLQTVSLAADRAAGLTRQLLMFSRKKVMQPQVLDLNDILGNMTKMLKRILGENITLESTYSAKTPPVLGDPGMVEQVVMNLSVNARDAMTRGGKLTISAGPVEIDEDYARHRPEAKPGPHLCLRVTDTGCGMDTAVMSRIFEPFFTTKEAGKGTGLGLATVYGIIKQHEGWIEVTSQVGEGTTFKIYLPATTHTAQAATRTSAPAGQLRGGHETVLVVEDEDVLREMARVILTAAGYRVLDAASGLEALLVWDQYADKVDLLLTDMVMPGGISGKDLADRLLAQQPGLKIIFTSGYSADEMSADFAVKNHAHVLQKPFNHATLGRAVRDCLDGKPANH